MSLPPFPSLGKAPSLPSLLVRPHRLPGLQTTNKPTGKSFFLHPLLGLPRLWARAEEAGPGSVGGWLADEQHRISQPTRPLCTPASRSLAGAGTPASGKPRAPAAPRAPPLLSHMRWGRAVHTCAANLRPHHLLRGGGGLNCLSVPPAPGSPASLLSLPHQPPHSTLTLHPLHHSMVAQCTYSSELAVGVGTRLVTWC